MLELKLDGHPVHIRSSQLTALTERGIVDGVVFLRSERGSQLPNAYVTGDHAPAFRGFDLVGCTDDPRVFELYQEMCAAIRADTWRAGARPTSA